jgi:two-component system cell cycle response regulator
MVATASVLVLDEDEVARDQLARALGSRGYLVTTASTAKEALDKLAEQTTQTFDILILDLVLQASGTDGIEVCRKVKASDDGAAPAVVFVSATTDVRAKVRALEAGGDDFLLKPVDLDELDARLRVIVRWLARTHKLLDETHRFRRVALVDALTDLGNRRALENELERAWARLQRGGKSLALLVIDIDRFKQVNDVHGHAAGDEVLKTIGATLSGAIRKVDQAFRLGGEEFVVLAPEADIMGAIGVAERIRQAVAQSVTTIQSGPTLTVTVSIGLSVAPDAASGTPKGLLEAADRALYDAKSSGRNRVAVAPAMLPQR